MEDFYNIKISPETILRDLSVVDYDGNVGEACSLLIGNEYPPCPAPLNESGYGSENIFVKNNREKHELPILPILQQWSMLHCLYQSYEHAFRAEYKGGFDVIIGNPPYVRPRELEQNEKEFYQKKYKTVSNQFDLYHR